MKPIIQSFVLASTLASALAFAALTPPLAIAQTVYAEDMATTPAVQVLRRTEKLGPHSVDMTFYGPSREQLTLYAEDLKKQLGTQMAALASAEANLLYQALKTSCTQTQGALNPRDVALREAWGFTPQSLSYRVPDPSTQRRLSKQLIQQGCDAIGPGQALSREYFAAGWLIDQSKALLRSPGLVAAKLHIDNVAYYAGAPPQAEAWKVPVYHPRKAEVLIQYFYLKDQSLVLLGDADTHFYANGLRYPDFLDGRTGEVHSESAGAYVLSPSALEAQLLARSVVLLTLPEAKALVEKSGANTRVIRWQEQRDQLTPQAFRSDALPTTKAPQR